MNERACAMPVLGCILNVHDLRNDFRLTGSLEETSRILGVRIGIGLVRERKHVARIRMVVVLSAELRWGTEAVVEESEASPGNVRNHTIEDDAALLVGIESI